MSIWDTVNSILAPLLLFMLIWQAYILIFNKGVPNIRTAPAIRRRIIEILQKEYKVHSEKNDKKFKIIDIGCGNGLFTREIAKALPEAEVIGLEWSKAAIEQAKIKSKAQKLTNTHYIRTDFYDYDLKDIDAAVMYLTIYDMGRMGEKLKKELKRNALVTCNRFKLSAGWEPEECLEIKTLYPHQKQLHIYRQKNFHS
ncbi:MAG: hypothetical protein CBB87_05930 [Micavibrio sp. TMED27]|nr:hypothetical protein [Micavibrio sp.]OUT91554.1 MAG: hypothetical protein CBB87_05930 [Micavibrio sp. TMED27]|tara:strand:+ start:2462 stop:3055 length:594 start_codon:yes stop_codon:yes gene_type:complete